jgi:hypothetical protein
MSNWLNLLEMMTRNNKIKNNNKKNNCTSKASFFNLQGGHKSKGEIRCKEIFEKIFQLPFKSVRPDWLKNPKTLKNLELDGYCEQLKLAFEYSGQQHYLPSPHLQTQEEFINLKQRDCFKASRCLERGVLLIIVPYTVIDIEKYIINELT